MAMQLILTQTVPHLGNAGQVVNVKPGFGRNYLIPRGLAVSATSKNKHELEHQRALIEKRAAKERASAEELSTKLSVMTLQFERLVGEDEKMFGSVTSRDIAEQLKKAGVDIDSHIIDLAQPVKAVGKYEVAVKLGSGVVSMLKFWVVGKAK